MSLRRERAWSNAGTEISFAHRYMTLDSDCHATGQCLPDRRLLSLAITELGENPQRKVYRTETLTLLPLLNHPPENDASAVN